jgi:hypothetical protein
MPNVDLSKPYKIPRSGLYNLVDWDNYTRAAAMRAGTSATRSSFLPNRPFK